MSKPSETPDRFQYEISDGSIHKVERATGKVAAEWQPIGTKVVEVFELRNNIVVREDYYQFPRDESNLYCLDSKFNLIWIAERTSPTDAYANSVFLENGALKCCSWEGSTATIDPETGKVIGQVFTK